jgi:hypothetical protein
MTLTDKVPENANQKAFICNKAFKINVVPQPGEWIPLNHVHFVQLKALRLHKEISVL